MRLVAITLACLALMASGASVTWGQDAPLPTIITPPDDYCEGEDCGSPEQGFHCEGQNCLPSEDNPVLECEGQDCTPEPQEDGE